MSSRTPVWATSRALAKRGVSLAGLTVLVGTALGFIIELWVYRLEPNSVVMLVETGLTIFGIVVGLYLIVDEFQMLGLMLRLDRRRTGVPK